MQIGPCVLPHLRSCRIERSDGEYVANVHDERPDSFTVHQSEFADFPQHLDYDAERCVVRAAIT